MTKEKKRKERYSAKRKIAEMKEKYGEAVSLIQDLDRTDRVRTVFKPDNNRMVFWLALAGLSEYEMAAVFGVPDVTFSSWKQKRPDFLAALQAGKAEAVAKCAHSLFMAGNGYSHDEEKLIPNRVKEYDPDTGRVVKEYTEILRVQTTKHYPPNVQALLKFLAAKHPEVWGDRSEVVHTGNVNHSIDASQLSKKKLKLLQKIAKGDVKAEENKEKPLINPNIERKRKKKAKRLNKTVE